MADETLCFFRVKGDLFHILYAVVQTLHEAASGFWRALSVMPGYLDQINRAVYYFDYPGEKARDD